jgi:hypothetical protein
MSCGIEEGLESVAAAIVEASNAGAITELASAVELLARRPCCESVVSQVVNVNGGVNGSLEGGVITYGTEPYMDFPTEIPEGYSDQSHFDSQLCARANALFDGIMRCLQILTGVTSLNAIAATVLVAVNAIGVIVLPEVMIPTLITAMAVAYLASGSLYSVMVELGERKQEVVCAMVSGDSMDVVIGTISELLDVIISAASVTGPAGLAIKTMLLIMFSADSLNWLIDKFAGFNYPDADCSDCEEEAECGDAGTPAHFPIHTEEGAGYFSYSDNVFSLFGTSDSAYGYRYSGWFGGTWQSPPYPARQAVFVDCSEGFDATELGGYFSLYKPDGSALAVGQVSTFGAQHLTDINDYLAANPTCLSIISWAYANEPSYVAIEFSE